MDFKEIIKSISTIIEKQKEIDDAVFDTSFNNIESLFMKDSVIIIHKLENEDIFKSVSDLINSHPLGKNASNDSEYYIKKLSKLKYVINKLSSCDINCNNYDGDEGSILDNFENILYSINGSLSELKDSIKYIEDFAESIRSVTD